MTLSQAAAALEAQVKSGLPPSGELEFARALAQALAGIAALGAQGGETQRQAEMKISPEECAQCDWHTAETLAAQLRGLLEGQDYVPHDLMSRFIEAAGCKYMRSELAILQRQVDSLDYKAGRTTLMTLKCSKGHRLNGDTEHAQTR